MNSGGFDTFHTHAEFVGVGGSGEGFLGGDNLLHDQFGEHLVEVDGPGAFFASDDGPEFAFAFFKDVFFDVGGVQHHFDDGDALQFRVDGGDEFLEGDGDEVCGEGLADVGVLFLGEELQEAGDGTWGAGGVNGGEDQVAGFGGLDRCLEGEAVAHFTDEDDVGVFTHEGADGGFIGFDVEADFALVDVGFVIHVEIFDGVFDGDDVDVFGFVDLFEHRGDGGGFTGTGDAGHYDDALFAVGDFGKDVGEPQFGVAGDFGVDAAGDDGGGAALPEYVDAEAFGFGHGVSHVKCAMEVIGGELLGIEHFGDHGVDLSGGERIGFEGFEFAIDADAGDGVGFNVDIGAVDGGDGLEISINAFFLATAVVRAGGDGFFDGGHLFGHDSSPAILGTTFTTTTPYTEYAKFGPRTR